MKITYYLEVLSSWCYWAEPTWAELRQRYGERVHFDWKIALMRPEDFPVSEEQCRWFYRRSGTIVRSPFMLNSGWFEAERKGNYTAPNLVAEACKDFGYTDDKLRLALTEAAVRGGRKLGNIVEAVDVAAAFTGVGVKELRQKAESPEILARVEASTSAFTALQVSQRPTFVLEDGIGDRAVFSGLTHVGPLVATVEAMLADTTAYASHAAHWGSPPAS